MRRVTWSEFDKHRHRHPQLWTKLIAMSLSLKRRGFKRYGIAGLFEHIRYEHCARYGTEFKIDNNLRAAYARSIMDAVPELDGFFPIRRSKLDNEQDGFLHKHEDSGPDGENPNPKGNIGTFGDKPINRGQNVPRIDAVPDPYSGAASARIRRRSRTCHDMGEDPFGALQ